MAAAAHAGPAAPRAPHRAVCLGAHHRAAGPASLPRSAHHLLLLGSEVGLAGQMAATPQPELPQRPPRCGCASISFRDVRWHEACLRQALCCAACCISHAAVRPSIQHAAPSTVQPAASHRPACSCHAIQTSSDASPCCTGVEESGGCYCPTTRMQKGTVQERARGVCSARPAVRPQRACCLAQRLLPLSASLSLHITSHECNSLNRFLWQTSAHTDIAFAALSSVEALRDRPR